MQQGGSHYGAPPSAPPPPPPQAEAVPPISSRPPPAGVSQLNFEELATTVSGSFHEEGAGGSGGGGSGIAPGNRWPRQETLALIRIRSDMDAAFREATLKGPLWEEVSRKLSEQGISRSAKKCKEKFENVHKYYKRTKEGRAGRQDGKSYRFFSELEAFHGTAASSSPTAAAAAMRSLQPTPLTSIPPQLPPPPPPPPPVWNPSTDLDPAAFSDFGFSSGSESGSGSESPDAATGRKRRRGGGTRKTMAMFGEMMRKVMDQQESMQRRLLDVIERREQDRMAREEAWRRQEAARLLREHELAAQERSMVASRDAAIIAFLRKISDGSTAPDENSPPAMTIQVPRMNPHQQEDTPSPPPPAMPPQPPSSLNLPATETAVGDPTSSRWPKAEVLALIDLRTALDVRYQDSGPKGPLWEEISAGMRRIGYARNAKRCKEKWENINKYFKKVKESNKKRPEDAKTCPYFHQLEAIYRSRSGGQHRSGLSPSNTTRADPTLPSVPIPQLPDAKANGGIAAVIAAAEKEAEDATVMSEGVKEMLQRGIMNKHSDTQDSASFSGHDEDDDYDDEVDGEDEKMGYKIEFQRPRMAGTVKNTNVGAAPPTGAGPPPTATTGPFLAMVQ